jgi:hypothetical protein
VSTVSTVALYWQPKNTPIITGYIKIDAQSPFGSPCGAWKDVTQEILSLGYVGKNLNPVVQSTDGVNVAANWNYSGPAGAGGYTWLPGLPGAQIAPSTCRDPHPNAIIRLERIRDNASSAPYSQPTGNNNWAPPQSSVAQQCGADPATGTLPVSWVVPAPTDFWPNALFDPREGARRGFQPGGAFNQRVTLGGIMNYVELDVNNLARWFSGAIGTSGSSTIDKVVAPNNFVVYFSDRRGNYAPAGSVTGTWPPLSPSGNETGEYGFSDFVNPADKNACPNNVLDAGEDLDGLGSPTGFFTYGEIPFPSPAAAASVFAYGSSLNATVADPNCPTGSAGINPWPGTYLVYPNEGRQNPPSLFRRALKLVNGNVLNLPACPGGVSCGLSIATENPMYVLGDFNANSASGGFQDHNVAVGAIADAVTLLSVNWNDVNSFSAPFNPGGRNAATSWYRMGVLAGKGLSFPIPAWDTTKLDGSQDFGTDGGVHNFMRYIENWGAKR